MRTGFIIRSKVGLAAWSIAILTILLAPLSNIASALPEGPQTMHVTGTVITQAGSPLDDASVTVDISHDSTNYNPFTSTTTDSNGTYAVDIIVGPSNQINDYNFTYTAPSGSGITEPITYRDLSFNNTVSDSMTLDAQFGNSLHIGGGYIWRDHRILYLEVVGIRNVTGAIPDSWGERWDGNDPTHDNGVQFGVGGQYALVPLPNMSGAGTHTIHVQAYDTMGSSNIISVPIDIGIDITLNSQPGTREDPSFSWAPVAGAAYYKVDDGGLATLPANQTSFTDIGAAAGGGGVTYYMVDAYDANDLLLNSGYLTLHIGQRYHPPPSERQHRPLVALQY
jgi:hypothetical protein